MLRPPKPKGPARPGDLEPAPETRAVRLPPAEEPHRGEHQDHLAERDPGGLREPEADAIGEGNVTELAEQMDIPEMVVLERNVQKTRSRVAAHPHLLMATPRRRTRRSTRSRRSR